MHHSPTPGARVRLDPPRERDLPADLLAAGYKVSAAYVARPIALRGYIAQQFNWGAAPFSDPTWQSALVLSWEAAEAQCRAHHIAQAVGASDATMFIRLDATAARMTSELIAEAKPALTANAIRAALRRAYGFAESEDETRSAGRRPESDYEQEPAGVMADCDAALTSLLGIEAAARELISAVKVADLETPRECEGIMVVNRHALYRLAMSLEEKLP